MQFDDTDLTMLVFFVVGLVIVGIGIFMLLRRNKLIRICTAQVEGTVTDCSRRVTRTSKGSRRVTYNATFTYSVDGVEYVQSVNRKYSVGQCVNVYYVPSDPILL